MRRLLWVLAPLLIATVGAIAGADASGQDPGGADNLPAQSSGDQADSRPPPFEVEVTARLGGDLDADDVIDGARLPATALANPELELRLTVNEPLCEATADYAWSVDGTPSAAQSLGGCVFLLTTSEGEHVIALVDRSAQDEPIASREVSVRDDVIVSIGDSVASGEGNPDRGGHLLRRATWLDQRCHRSMLSGAARAAIRTERGNRSSRVTFVPLGCSGASVPRGLLGEYRGFEPSAEPIRAQVDELNDLAGGGTIDAVLVNIGGNDIAFESIIRFCAGVKNCPDKRFDRGGFRQSKDPGDPLLRTFVGTAVRRLSTRLDELNERISPLIEPEQLLLVEYFDPTQGPDRSCKMLGGLVDRDESQWAHDEVLGPLNQTLKAAAQRHGWTYVDGVDEAFAGHGICAGSDERWIRTPTESFVKQGTFDPVNRLSGTLHPNGAGHRETARLIGTQLAPLLGAEFDENPVAPLGSGLSGLAWFLIAIGAAILLATATAVTLLVLRSRRRAD